MALVDPPVQRVSVAGSMREINPLEWDRCVGSDAALAGHAHLDMLEQSGTVTPETGFKARHVLVHDQTGRLVAAAPAWLKTHSNGELGIDLGRLADIPDVGGGTCGEGANHLRAGIRDLDVRDPAEERVEVL